MKLTKKQYIALASMLFGMFFGAGNLIFPAFMGQMAGANSPMATLGFLVTGVGLPLLSIIAMGISRSDGMEAMAERVGRGYSLFFTCALYLTIGPLFAIPRTATVSFSVGIESMMPEAGRFWLLGFSVLFFAATLFFSLHPSKILTWIGRIINPLFLVFLGVLLITALVNPMGPISAVEPTGKYVEQSFLTGFLEGYNTLDVLAGLAFGIVIINVVKELGVFEPKDIAKTTMKAGVLGFILMSVIYVAITLVGAQSRTLYPLQQNGGPVLSLVARHYFGGFGAVLLAATVIFACLKTAIGLVTSCAENFAKMFPRVMKYRGWAILFSAASFVVANFGLNAILTWSLPVLMFLYPLSITLILLNTFGGFFSYAKPVFVWTTALTIPAALLDLIRALPVFAVEGLHLGGLIALAEKALPLYTQGLGWVVPALVGFVIGFVVYRTKQRSA